MKRVFILLIVISCNNSERPLDLGELGPPKGHTWLEVSAYYPLGDKYYNDADSIHIENWRRDKVPSIVGIQGGENIFLHNGGGPNGAEWNAEVDLYLAINHFGLEGYDVYINDSLFVFESVQEGDTDWICVPVEMWLPLLRPIEEADLPYLFSTIDIESEKNGVLLSPAPLNTGELIKFTIKGGDHELINYFHVAYGE
jgi:hypothetical protein